MPRICGIKFRLPKFLRRKSRKVLPYPKEIEEESNKNVQPVESIQQALEAREQLQTRLDNLFCVVNVCATVSVESLPSTTPPVAETPVITDEISDIDDCETCGSLRKQGINVRHVSHHAAVPKPNNTILEDKNDHTHHSEDLNIATVQPDVENTAALQKIKGINKSQKFENTSATVEMGELNKSQDLDTSGVQPDVEHTAARLEELGWNKSQNFDIASIQPDTEFNTAPMVEMGELNKSEDLDMASIQSIENTAAVTNEYLNMSSNQPDVENTEARQKIKETQKIHEEISELINEIESNMDSGVGGGIFASDSLSYAQQNEEMERGFIKYGNEDSDEYWMDLGRLGPGDYGQEQSTRERLAAKVAAKHSRASCQDLNTSGVVQPDVESTAARLEELDKSPNLNTSGIQPDVELGQNKSQSSKEDLHATENERMR